MPPKNLMSGGGERKLHEKIVDKRGSALKKFAPGGTLPRYATVFIIMGNFIRLWGKILANYGGHEKISLAALIESVCFNCMWSGPW